ncbi:hypothetical protein C6380_24900 [Pseudomonas syringae pv. actinidiae]|nr:hypothetical protein C6380_24900 [Pseudomonas syringae pv. actinidiae]
MLCPNTKFLTVSEGSGTANPHATTGYIALPHTDHISQYNEALLGGLAAPRCQDSCRLSGFS